MICILVADDQSLVRGGLRMILDAQPDITVAAEAADGRAVLRLASELELDLVSMDVQMPGLDGIATTRRLLAQATPAPKVFVLTTFDLDEYVYEAIRAGASGFTLKAAAEQLVAGVRSVVAGDALWHPRSRAALCSASSSARRRLRACHLSSRPSPPASSTCCA
jgi:DNA-binding NarL/FixJ family response regulator